MGYSNQGLPQGVPKFYYVGPLPADTGNTLTSGLLLNTETTFGSRGTIPGGTLTSGSSINLTIGGIFSNALGVSLGLTLYVRVGGQLVGTGTMTLAANVANRGWAVEMEATMFSDGTGGYVFDVQGNGEFYMAATTMTPLDLRNIATFVLDPTLDQTVTVGVSFGLLSVGGSMTLRQLKISAT